MPVSAIQQLFAEIEQKFITQRMQMLYQGSYVCNSVETTCDIGSAKWLLIKVHNIFVKI